MSEFDNIMKDLEDTLGQSINDVDRANKAMDQIEAQDVNGPNYKVPLETPQWGEEAADIILRMAGDRADYITNFGQDVVKRAEAWKKVADQLAADIRATAVKEAESIRRETARMLKAGNRIEVAMREFSPEQEKYNGRDRRAVTTKSGDPKDDTARESIHRAATASANSSARARQGTTEGGQEPVSLRAETPTNPQAWPTDDGKPVPGFLRRQRATLDHD